MTFGKELPPVGATVPPPASAVQQPHEINELSTSPAYQRLQLTVTYQSRSISVNVGPNPIVAELLPDIARRLGVQDPTIVHGGFSLMTEAGIRLDPAKTFSEQQVGNHSRLSLQIGMLNDDEVVYDDVVEAVGSSVARSHLPWSNEQTTLTTLVICAGLMLMGVFLLAVLPATALNASLGLGMGAVLVAMGAVLDYKAMVPQALTVSLLASLFTAIGACQMMMATLSHATLYGTAFLAAAVGLIVSGAISTVACPRSRPYTLIPLSFGILMAIPSLLAVLFPSALDAIWILYAICIALVANILPWASMSSARLSVDSPQNESEIFELPQTIDIKDIRRRYLEGSMFLFIGRIATAAVLLVAAPLMAAARSPLAGIACMLAFTAMLVGSRQIYTMREMIVTLTTAGIGIMIVCAVFIRAHAQYATALTITLICCATATVAVAFLSKAQSLFASRIADSVEVVCLVCMLPLAYLAVVM